MAKRKVAILGGGMAGLAAAYELSKTPQLRDAFEITLYQMGWRLGGKGASGRDAWARVQEHGLHFWFGFYENAFRMLREVYASVQRESDDPLCDWREALKPQRFTPIGVETEMGQGFWPLTWPIPAGTPGDGGLFPSLMDLLGTSVGVLKGLIEYCHEMRGYLIGGRFQIPAGVSQASRLTQPDRPPASTRLSNILSNVHSWIAPFSDDRLARENLDGILWLLGQIWQTAKTGGSNSGAHMMSELLHVGTALVRGVILDLLVKRRTLDDLSDIEFRDWLITHGADREVVRKSTVLRAFYDTVIQYEEGDVERPNMAAGAAIVVWLRMIGTTKGAMTWELQTGMGEAIIAPIYRLLVQNGVSFKFFRRVDRLELSNDRRQIRRIHLSRQVDLKRNEYRPTISIGGLVCWPAEPLWDQIVHGEKIYADKINFESRWCHWPPAGREVLEQGKDFHEVVLAISIGAFKQLNADPGLADELIGANDAFASMTRKIGLIPTHALQVWFNRDSASLGWRARKPATVAGPEPLGIWADMSQSLRFEPWDRAGTPRSVHYFCGPLNTSLYRRARSHADTPAIALDRVRQLSLNWLERNLRHLLPDAVRDDGKPNWNLLHTINGDRGRARFNQQYFRANIDPSDCCPGSAAGSTRYRLAADASGFDNLYLAGCWVKTGLNTASVESAVMAGMQAARAITGSSDNVWGEKLTFRR